MQERGSRIADYEFLSCSWFCVIEVDTTTGPPLTEHGPKISKFAIRNAKFHYFRYNVYPVLDI